MTNKKYKPDKTYTFSTYIKLNGDEWKRYEVANLTDIECELIENLIEQGQLYGWSLIGKLLSNGNDGICIKNAFIGENYEPRI